jgi:hypothetical protein
VAASLLRSAAAALGAKGGKARTEAQNAARRANGQHGGRPRTLPRCAACEAAGKRCRSRRHLAVR